MDFLKSCILLCILISLYSCSGKIAKKTKPETVPATATTGAEPTPETVRSLPQFMVLDASGKTADIQSFKGKKVFVNFWATWCPPCRAEMPSIEKLYRASDKEKAQFVMISLDSDFESAKKYVQAKGLTMPVFYPAADLPDLFAVKGIPATFIFNEAGTLIEQHEGSADYNTAEYRRMFGAVN